MALILARTVMGIGGRGLLVLPEVILPDIVPLKVRGTWIVVVNAAYAKECLACPVLGGIFAEKMLWRWAFLFNIPLIVLALLLIGPFLRLPLPSEAATEPVWSRLRRSDWVGITIFIPSITLAILPVTWSAYLFPLLSYATIETLIIAFMGLIGLGTYERFFATEPLLPTSIFRKGTVIITYYNIMAVGAVIYAQVYFIPLWAQATRGFGPILAGVSTLPFAGILDLVAVLVGIAIKCVGKYRWSNISRFALQALGLGLLSFLERDLDGPTAQWALPMILAGVGSGCLCASLRITIQSAVSNEKTADAMSFYSFIRNIGMTLGTALSGTIFQNQIRKSLSDVPTLRDQADEFSKDVVALITIIPGMRGLAEQRSVKVAYADAFSTINLALCGLSILGFLVSFFVKAYDMNRGIFEAVSEHSSISPYREGNQTNANYALFMNHLQLPLKPIEGRTQLSSFRASHVQLDLVYQIDLVPPALLIRTPCGVNHVWDTNSFRHLRSGPHRPMQAHDH